MFSRMFAEPLFDINYMNKEIEAVNSENEKNCKGPVKGKFCHFR